jgi:hypothetical protein
VLLVRTVLVLALGIPLASSSCSVADLTAGGPDAENRSDASESPDAGSGFVTPAMPVAVENLLNKRYLDVSNVSTSDSAQVWTWSYTGQLNQLWAFMGTGDGTYEIVNKLSNKCLEVRGETTANGSYIQQFGCHGSDNQRWSVNRFHDHDQIVGKQSGRCLSSSAMEDGATVTILDCSNDSSQHWSVGR